MGVFYELFCCDILLFLNGFHTPFVNSKSVCKNVRCQISKMSDFCMHITNN